MSPSGVFVTGTDTGVGKTVVSAVLARGWGADYWKAVQTGLDEDLGDPAAVAALTGHAAGRIIAPRHAFKLPLSPHIAAKAEGVQIALDDFVLPETARPLVVEGAGGVLVPLNDTEVMADLIARLGLPAVLAVRDRLGAVNHALLSLEALRTRRIPVMGLVMVGGPFADNAEIIVRHGKAPVLLRLEWIDPLTPAQIEAWARRAPRLA